MFHCDYLLLDNNAIIHCSQKTNFIMRKQMNLEFPRAPSFLCWMNGLGETMS